MFLCDRLTFASAIRVRRLRRERAAGSPVVLRVLDPLPAGWKLAVLTWWLRAAGVAVESTEFFAGHLPMPDGRPAQVAAVRSAMDMAFIEAARMVEASPRLKALDAAWGRHTVTLHVAKVIALAFATRRSLYAYALRVKVARALVHRDGAAALLCLEAPVLFGQACVLEIAGDMPIHFWGHRLGTIWARGFVLRQAIRIATRRFSAGMLAFRARRRVAALTAIASERPGLLLVQEADLGLEREYRLQPHWLLPDDPPTDFATYVLAHTPPPRAPHDAAALAARHVHVLSDADVLALSKGQGDRSLARRLRQSSAAALRAGWQTSDPAEATALAMTARVMAIAAELAGVSQHLRVKAFLTAENYLLQPDAVQFLADGLNIQTMSYQYSNLGSPSPVMFTTADLMLTFSPQYHQFWRHDLLAPGAFLDVGYTYDSSFAFVRPRAAAVRDALRARGATFVIGYYDESVQRDKYGLTSPEDHCHELRALLELVVADPAVGVIVKVQYQRHSPSRFPELASLVEVAVRTGRFVEMLYGVHRNIILPAEAALASDVVIGHAVGGAAALEAAMAGTRSLILNPYRMTDGNHAIYRRADILFDSMEDALTAVADFRAGRRAGLGDWAPVAAEFDPYRDGRSGRRIRAILDRVMTRVGPKIAARDLQPAVAAASMGPAH